MKNNKNNSKKVYVRYLNHACFLIGYRDTLLMIDPFFLGKFFWQDHIEVQVDKPDIKLEDLPEIDMILCSHIHGDHFEIETISKLIQRDNSILIAPADVIKFCVKTGLDKTKLLIAKVKEPFCTGDIRIICLPSKGYENERECSKLSFLIECEEKKIFYSGDSHGYSETWNEYRGKINLACLWCVKTEEIIENLQPEKVVLYHFEKFSPGNFSCNIEVSQLIGALEKKFRTIIFYNPLKKNTVIL